MTQLECGNTFTYKIKWPSGEEKNLCQCHISRENIWLRLCCLWRRQWRRTPVLLPGESHGWRSLVGCSPWGRKSQTRLSNFTFTFHFHALEKEMATHSSVLAWRIPGMREPGGLPSMGSHRVGHDWSHLAAAAVLFMKEESCHYLLLRETNKSDHRQHSLV